MPGIDSNGGVTGLGARLMMRLQLGLGQATRWEELLQMSRQLQGQRTYFLPGGALRMGVASLHCEHLTTCCSFFHEISIKAWQTRHVTMTLLCCSCWYGGGTSSGPIEEAVTIACEGCSDAESARPDWDDCFKSGCFSDSPSMVADDGCGHLSAALRPSKSNTILRNLTKSFRNSFSFTCTTFFSCT